MANCNYKVSIKDIQNKYKFKIFSAPRGEKGEKGEQGDLNHNDIVDNLTSTDNTKVLSAKQGKVLKDLADKKAYYFNNVATMKSNNLHEGDYVITKGYYTDNDGGNAEYKVTSSQSQTEHQETLNNGLYATLISDNQINIKQLGCSANNTANENTTVLNNIFSKFSNILIKDIDLTINDNLNIQSNQKIEIVNSNILNSTTTNQKYIFYINGKENIQIIGNNSSLLFNKPSTDQQACLKIINSKNVYVDGIDLLKAGGDGICVSGTDNETISENINISNLTINNNRRNGVALIGGVKGFYISNCKIMNTSGTNPQYGIDIETWQDGIYNDTIKIDNCYFEGNVDAIGIFPYTKNLIIENNTFISDGIQSVAYETKGEASYPKNVVIKNNYIQTSAIYLRGTQFAEYIIENNNLVDGARITTDSESDMTNYYTGNPKNGYVIIKNNLVKEASLHGITIGGSSNVIIDGNTIIKPKERAFSIVGSNNVKIINNTIIDHAQTETSPESKYIMNVTTTHNVSFINNIISNSALTTFTTLLHFAASVQNVVITNNQALKINYTNFISKDGTITKQVVDNNLTNS